MVLVDTASWTNGAHRNFSEHLFLNLMLLVSAATLAALTSRVFVRPLELLERAIAAAAEGRREKLQVSRTGDEIEGLGKSFNRMIVALAASETAVREHQEQLEHKIRERTVELEEAKKRAESASRAKSDFLANMSHELRTPMNGVMGMLDIVLEGGLTVEQRDQLVTAKECSVSLLALVNEILDLAKIEAKKMTLEKIPFRLRPVLVDACKALLPKARAKGVELVCEAGGELPDWVIGDPLRLRQVLVNLVGNAVKFTEQGSVRLRAEAVPAGRAGAVELRLAVIDTGIGMPEGKLGSIFENFTQADSSVTRKYGGTGLGLSISKQIVELHGGRIWAESETGKGCVFHVVLVLEEDRSASVAAGQDPALPAGESPKSIEKPGRILVAEDNPVNQRLVATILGKNGYEATVVGNGKEVLTALEEAAYDLVLMDVQMPVMDGLEAARRIRGNPRWEAMPIVALTAHAMGAERKTCLEAGMNDFLAKPFAASDLLATLRRHLAGR
jgi:signal transduction histidine kinase/ActR/RegA family two-component response regulator